MGGIKKLRTLVPTPTHADTACSLAKDLQCLRVLKWPFDNKFPPPISTLVHLRYLSFSQTELKTFPPFNPSAMELAISQFAEIIHQEIARVN